MAAPMRVSRFIELQKRFFSSAFVPIRFYSKESSDGGENKQEVTHSVNTSNDLLTDESEDPSKSMLSFAEAFAKHATLQVDQIQQQEKTSKEEPDDFATLLRNSTHIHIGAPKGQVVIGKIFHVVEDDLYIDFGGKFHCVCKRPSKENPENYYRGANVRIRLKDIEVADHFIGATRDFSILEADADLLGLMDKKTPVSFDSNINVYVSSRQ